MSEQDGSSSRQPGIGISGGEVQVTGDLIGGNKYVIEAPPPQLRALHQLPPPPADFIGREEELKELLAAVATGGVTISGLQGQGGIGKTTLALKLAEKL